MNPWRGLAGLPRASFLIALATFINRAGVMVRPYLVLFLSEDRGLGTGVASSMLVLYGATTFLAAPLSGWLSDRFGASRVLRCSLLLAAVAMACYPLAHGVVAIAAATFFFSLFNEMPRPALMMLVAEVAPPERRKQAFVLSRVAVNLGFAIGPALGGFLVRHSYLAIFWVDAAASFLAAVVLLLQKLPRVTHAERPHGSALAALVKDRTLLLFFAGTLLTAIVFFQHDAPLLYVMHVRLGMLESDYGLLFTINTLLIVLVEVEFNLRLDHWPQRRALVVGALLNAAGLGALAFATRWPAFAACVVVWTFGEMLAMPAMTAFVHDLAPPARRGLYMGTLTLAFGAGLTIGPKAGMTILDAHPGSTWQLWALMGAIGLCGAAIYLLLPKRSRGDAVPVEDRDADEEAEAEAAKELLAP